MPSGPPLLPLLLPLLVAEAAGLEGALSGGGGGGGSAAEDMMFRLRHPLLPGPGAAGMRRPRPGWLRRNGLVEERAGHTDAPCAGAPRRA